MIGKTLGHHQITEKLGAGGMGEVFLAQDTSPHRRVALNLLPLEMQQDESAHKCFVCAKQLQAGRGQGLLDGREQGGGDS